MELPVTFKSAVGPFYYGVLLFVIVITAVAFIPAWEQQGEALLFPFLITVIFGCGLPVWLLVATDYTVTLEELKIRCGPFKWTIKRNEIRSIKPSRNLISSPALSLNRLEIRYGSHKSILVSPADRFGFYQALGFTPEP